MFEYLQEVQVKTSGISAEYGGALGGVVSAVTKSGGNTFRGEAHYYFEGSALAAGPVKRLVLDPRDRAHRASTSRTRSSRPSTNEFGGSIGGPIVRTACSSTAPTRRATRSATNNYNFADGTTATIERDIWNQQAFGKLSLRAARG